ncbi:MAG TPA: hypothetical protein VK473_14235 [Terriglobales bacterium]|nr:hypothetical protein [Terriglobales bacterium]
MPLSFPLCRYLREIAHHWPDFQFTTADGRVFAYLDESINSILPRIEARKHILLRSERTRLGEIQGAIVELDTFDPPMIYSNRKDLVRAWLELHDSFDVELTQQEWDTLLGIRGATWD